MIDLRAAEARVYSMTGEDGVLASLFRAIPPVHRYAVEFGALDGLQYSNTRNLFLNGWGGLLIEVQPDLADRARALYRERDDVRVATSRVTPLNIESLLAEHGVPLDLDLLVVDIDSYDLAVWRAVSRWRPSVVCIEYNATFAPPARVEVPFVDSEAPPAPPGERRVNTDYFGASLQSICDVARDKGYELVYCETRGVNAFLVAREHYAGLGIADNRPETLYRPPAFGSPRRDSLAPNRRGFPHDSRWDAVLGP